MGLCGVTGAAGCGIHHTAYLVEDLGAAIRRWTQCVGASVECGPINVSAHEVRVCFLRVPGGRVELVQPLRAEGRMLRWERPDHVCFSCDDFDRRVEGARDDGGIVVRPPVRSEAFGGRRMCFVLYQGVGLIEWVER